MKKFKQFREENYNGRSIVKHGIKISFHDDRVDFHKGAKLVHSHKGDYKNTTKGHMTAATNKAVKLQADSDHFKPDHERRFKMATPFKKSRIDHSRGLV